MIDVDYCLSQILEDHGVEKRPELPKPIKVDVNCTYIAEKPSEMTILKNSHFTTLLIDNN